MSKRKFSSKLSLNLEIEGFEELKSMVDKIWENNIPFLDGFRKVNVGIRLYVKENKLQLISTNVPVDKDLLDLYNRIWGELVEVDPILSSIHIFNSIEPEDLKIRQFIRSLLPRNVDWPYYNLLTTKDCLRDAKHHLNIQGKVLSGVPFSYLFAGKVLKNMIEDFDHFTHIDAVKEAGAEEPIGELRKIRFYRRGNDLIWDYYPIVRYTITPGSKIIVEVFSEEQFKEATNKQKEFDQKIDNFLVSQIQHTKADSRNKILFGQDIRSGVKYSVRYGNEEISVNQQLLPKYLPMMVKEGKKHTLTKLKKEMRSERETDDQDREDTVRDWGKIEDLEDELQTAAEGLLKGVMTWKAEEGPATSWLSNNIRWNLGNAFDDLSSELDGKRKLKEEIDSSGGYLHQEDGEDSERTHLDALEERGSILSEYGGTTLTMEQKRESPYERRRAAEEEKVENEAILAKSAAEQRISNILKKKEQKIPLTPAERQTLKRFRDKNIKK